MALKVEVGVVGGSAVCVVHYVRYLEDIFVRSGLGMTVRNERTYVRKRHSDSWYDVPWVVGAGLHILKTVHD